MGVGVSVSSLHRQALAPKIPQGGLCASIDPAEGRGSAIEAGRVGAHRATIEPCWPIREGGSNNTPFIFDDVDDGFKTRDIG